MDLAHNFDDITPVQINEESPQLCQILYDDEYKTVMGLLLALLKKEEYSERALYLSELGIELLASHYTIWVYRYNILVNLKKDLFEELDWCEQIALDNEKNYQIWNYRQLIITKILEEPEKYKFDSHRENPLIGAMLESDPKNHHVWSYRKWLVEKFDLFADERELQFLEGTILLDLRNNSAWSHRYFLKFGNPGLVTKETIAAEIEYTKTLIHQSPQNPSSWNYLIGIYQKQGLDFAELESFCSGLADIEHENIKSSFALEVLAKIYNIQKKFDQSRSVYDLLGEKYDPIRSNYWKFEKNKVGAAVN